jgi:hypothetical protein
VLSVAALRNGFVMIPCDSHRQPSAGSGQGLGRSGQGRAQPWCSE